MEVIRHLDDPTAVPKGKEPPLTTEFEALWVPESVWTFWTRGAFLGLSRIDPQLLDFSIHRPVTTTTKLSRFEKKKNEAHKRLYEGESNEDLKYVLSRNLLNTKGT